MSVPAFCLLLYRPDAFLPALGVLYVAAAEITSSLLGTRQGPLQVVPTLDLTRGLAVETVSEQGFWDRVAIKVLGLIKLIMDITEN